MPNTGLILGVLFSVSTGIYSIMGVDSFPSDYIDAVLFLFVFSWGEKTMFLFFLGPPSIIVRGRV